MDILLAKFMTKPIRGYWMYELTHICGGSLLLQVPGAVKACFAFTGPGTYSKTVIQSTPQKSKKKQLTDPCEWTGYRNKVFTHSLLVLVLFLYIFTKGAKDFGGDKLYFKSLFNNPTKQKIIHMHIHTYTHTHLQLLRLYAVQICQFLLHTQ